MKKIQDIYDFIDRAERSRKYPPNTAGGIRAALKLFDAELNDEERSSLDKFEENLEQIYQMVFSRNKNFSASSLATYKSRVQKVLSDYRKYGIDPTKMNGWSPKIVSRQRKEKGTSGAPANLDAAEAEEQPTSSASPLAKIDLPLRPGVKATISVPQDITDAECKRIQAVLSSLVIPTN